MADLLSPDTVADALAHLTGWTGGAERIERSVEVTGERRVGLVADVMAAADALNHHPVVSESDDAVSFAVWTHSAGGVTVKDLELAARIDELVVALT